jgi:leucyl aminopeptidase
MQKPFFDSIKAIVTFIRSKLQVIMITSLKLMSTAGKDDHLLLVVNDRSGFDSPFLSAEEKQYVRGRLKENKSQISINQYKKMIYVQQLSQVDDHSKSLENYRKAGAQWAQRFNAAGHSSVTLVDNGSGTHILALAEGILLANYQFLKYRSEAKKESNSLKSIFIVSNKITKQEVSRLATVVEATCHARDLVNEPQSFLNATVLAGELKSFAKNAGFRSEVFDKKKIKQLKMGGLLSVNLGSLQPPTFTVLEYKPKEAVNKKPIVLVGKGVVYDTGGMSLKPTANSMDYMKCDMAGGAVVGAAMFAAAKEKLPLYIIGLVPATDNRVDGDAYVPGDVITMMSGKTVEVLNTDAEGRLILADALHFAKRFDPEVVLEFSTLTGSAAATLGHYGIVAMGNAGDEVRENLVASGEEVYERLGVMPFWDEYNDLLKSDIADLKNIGGANAGAITAGKFLENFTSYPFMHLDIAGPAFNKSADSYRGKNGTGVGVRLMFEYFLRRAGLKKPVKKSSTRK